VGRNAISSTVGSAIASTDSVNACLRPTRSATRPNTKPPSGLTKKPAANAPNAAISETAGLSAGKNCCPMTLAKYP
jgi:hypothetical protein